MEKTTKSPLRGRLEDGPIKTDNMVMTDMTMTNEEQILQGDPK